MPPHVMAYLITALPPLDAGGVNEIVAWPLPFVTVPIVGASGTAPVMPKLACTDAAAKKVVLPA